MTELLADPAQSFQKTLRIMMSTNHLGTNERPQVHPVVAATARELLNKSENERSGVLSTAVSFLNLYRDPTIARNTDACDWRIADLMAAEKPVTLYLVVPPSDISRTKPLIRLVLNQIGRRLTETLGPVEGGAKKRPLLMMLDEFPALGRLDFFESALAFMAGYGVRVYLIAQSLNQIAKAYGENNARLLPMIAPLQRSFRVDQDVGDVLHVADFGRSFAHFKQRVVAGGVWIGRIEQQAMGELRPPSRRELPVLALDVVYDRRRGPGQQRRQDKADALA